MIAYMGAFWIQSLVSSPVSDEPVKMANRLK